MQWKIQYDHELLHMVLNLIIVSIQFSYNEPNNYERASLKALQNPSKNCFYKTKDTFFCMPDEFCSSYIFGHTL